MITNLPTEGSPALEGARRPSRALDYLRDRAEIGVLALIVSSIFLLPQLMNERAMPAGLWGSGLVGGAALAIQATGIVLVYRSNRIINFAQLQIGATCAAFFVAMVQLRPLARLASTICPPCQINEFGSGFLKFNYYLSLVLALGMAMGIAYLIYFVARRFQNAPRLVLTVATIFSAQMLAGFQGTMVGLLASETQREGEIQLVAVGPPIQISFRIGGTTFNTPDILMVAAAVVAVAALTAYFRLSSTGVAIRASAENADRAKGLGINTTRVTGRVWLISGFLSAIAAILTAMSIGASPESTLSASAVVRILTVGVIARLVSLPLTIAAAAVLGMFEQAILWFFSSVTPLDGLLLVIVAVVLLVQRYRGERAEVAQASGWRAAREIRPIPEELRSLPVVRKWTRATAGVAGMVLLGFPWVMSPSQISLWTTTMIFGIVALSMLILTGWAGQISLGQFALAAIGGYVAAVVPAPFLIRLILAGVAGGVAATVIGLPALKMRGLHLAITTLTFALATTAILLNPNYLGRALPASLERPSFLGLDMESGRVYYYFTLLVLGLIFAAVMGMRRSRTARALIAARDNEQAAQSFGINLVRSRLQAFAVSGVIAAIAGALYAFQQHGVASIAYAPEVSVRMFLISTIGGFGAVSGPLFGVFFFEGILSLLSNVPEVAFLATGLGGLAVVLLAPGGLAQMFFNARDAALRSIARRNRIVVPSLVADVQRASAISERARIAPKSRPGGGSAFVPKRYQVPSQWALPSAPEEDNGEAAEFSAEEGSVSETPEEQTVG